MKQETIFGFPVVIDDSVPRDCVVVVGHADSTLLNLQTGISHRYTHEYWRAVADKVFDDWLKRNGDPI